MISFPPPYFRKIWHYRKAKTDLIRKAISNFNWGKAFYTTNATKKLYIFHKIILNVLSNYIPHETLTYNDKDPPRFNFRIESLLQDKNKPYKDCRRSNTNAQSLNKLNHFQEQLSLLINRSKQNCCARMTKNVTNVSKKFKAYWSLLRRLLNNKKIPLILLLFRKKRR